MPSHTLTERLPDGTGQREQSQEAQGLGPEFGRPKGSLGVSRLDGREDDIRRFIELGVSKTAIAKLTGVSRTALDSSSFRRANVRTSRRVTPRRDAGA